MFYKNLSTSTMKFYGVEFRPGEVKEVPGYINDFRMFPVDDKSNSKGIRKTRQVKVEDKPSETPEIIKQEESPNGNNNDKWNIAECVVQCR